jgi:alpha-amylase/alpha-mannosidase (GH57 family)
MTGCEGAGAPRRFVIIHGHFYQPPRENPWFDRIERQVSAAPYHDWNECVYDQCYRPNAFSRLLDPKGMIVDIHNNYENLSFNFGPTLFSWLLCTHPKIAQRIIDADRESIKKMSGHGNAIGQVYNHSIMPLSSRRDQLTQIRWAKAFFRKHFGRDTEGLWLAETAINMETVRCLIEEGIRFVILSPSQAESIRPLDGSRGWSAAAGGIDTRRPYRIFPTTRDGGLLPGYLDVFFFDESLSRETSFGDVLDDARRFAARIRSCFDERSREDAAVVLATDGETFGHHKPLSDMCLAYFFCKVAPAMNLTPVNFGWYLETHQPAWEVTLRDAFGEGTAWSCSHGVGRWTRDCGCKTGGQASWKQEWRTPLRVALSMLHKRIDEAYETTLAPLFADPWTLRDSYPAIAEARSFLEMKKLVESCGALKPLSGEQALAARRLIEAQKYMLFAFTSCGWFFSDVGGIETVQNIAYAARALQLGIEPGRFEQVRDEWLALLEKARSNRPGITGGTLFTSEVARYLRYEEIVAFAAVAEKIILLEEKPRLFAFDYDHFHVTLTRLEEFRNRDGYCAYTVDL